MKSLTAVTVFAIWFVWEKPVEAALYCDFVSRGHYLCHESVVHFPSYLYTAIGAQVAQVSGAAYDAHAYCDNIDTPATVQAGRYVQDVRGANVRVRYWVLDPLLPAGDHSQDILCEGEGPELHAYVRGGVLWGNYGSWWWDYWCSVTDWNAGQCYHPDVFSGFYSWYLEYY